MRRTSPSNRKPIKRARASTVSTCLARGDAMKVRPSGRNGTCAGVNRVNLSPRQASARVVNFVNHSVPERVA